MSNSGAYRYHDNATTRAHGKISIFSLSPLSRLAKIISEKSIRRLSPSKAPSQDTTDSGVYMNMLFSISMSSTSLYVKGHNTLTSHVSHEKYVGTRTLPVPILIALYQVSSATPNVILPRRCEKRMCGRIFLYHAELF